jgi:uncharacterized membrane protein YfcA
MASGYHPAMGIGEISLPLALALIAGGFVAGFINVVAGGGSLVTLPILIFTGLDASMANATNRVAILAQNLVATRTFAQKKLYKKQEALPLISAAVVGAIVGSFIVVQVPALMLKGIIAGLIVVMVLLIVFKRGMWSDEERKSRPRWQQVLLLFGVGLYGGFIQAGVGLFFVWALVGAAAFPLLKANAYKVLIVLCYTAFALAVFIGHGLVDFRWGLILALGNMAGARVAAKMAIQKGNAFLRGALFVMATASALKLFWDLFQEI